MDRGLLSPFYYDDAAFDGSERRSAQILKMLMKRGTGREYFSEPDKSFSISDTPGQEEATKIYFAAEGLVLNFVSGSIYLGAYLGPQEELEAWLKPQVEAWSHGVRVLGKIAQQHPQIFNFNAGSYLLMTPEKILAKAEKEKKDLYLQDCLERRRTFTPMVYSADRLPGAEALSAQKRLAALLRYNLKQEYYEMCGFVRARM